MSLHSTLLVLVAAIALPACSSGPAVSNDPSRPVYRSDAFSLAAFQSVKLHFVSVTATGGQAQDMVRAEFEKSLKTQLARAFSRVEVGDAAASQSEALLDVIVKVDWGTKAERYLGGYGSGASAEIKYQLHDFSGRLLAKLEEVDALSYTSARGDTTAMIQKSADQWSTYFVDHVLKQPAN